MKIVLNGYGDATSSTKAHEHVRRLQQLSCEVLFNPDMKQSISEEKFLSSSANKTRLIHLCQKEADARGISWIQATGDADSVISVAALSAAEPVLVTAKDMDNSSGTCRNNTTYSRSLLWYHQLGVYLYPRHTGQRWRYQRHHLFRHAKSGCDSVSAVMERKKSLFTAGL